MKALIYVYLRDEVPDNSGKIVADRLNEQGFSEVINVKIGKLIELEFDSSSGVEIQRRIDQMCTLLLADSDIENYQVVKIVEDRN